MKWLRASWGDELEGEDSVEFILSVDSESVNSDNNLLIFYSSFSYKSVINLSYS